MGRALCSRAHAVALQVLAADRTQDRYGQLQPLRGNTPLPQLRESLREILESQLLQLLSAGRIVAYRACDFIEFDVGRQIPCFEIGGRRIEVVNRRKGPASPPEPQEAMVAQVIVDIGDQYVERHAPVQGPGIGSGLRAMPCQRIDDFRIADCTLRRS